MRTLSRAIWAALTFGALAALGCGDSGAGATSSAADGGTTPPPSRKDAGGAKDATVPGHDAAPGADGSGDDDAGGDDDATTAADVNPPPPGPLDVTFFVMADSHADPVLEDDLLAQVRAINAIPNGGRWPASIDGTATGFVGGPIAPPRGIVVCGDITGWGTAPTEIPMFQHYFEKGSSSDSVAYPMFVGLGNHDVSTADRDDVTAAAYRAKYWAYVDARHKGPSAPVPVTAFDDASHNYSWDWDRLHLVMTHRFVGDVEYGLGSGTGFLADDLKKRASDGRPVIVFHHYGMDAFGTNGQWWNQADRDTYRGLLTGYGVTAIFTGHTHYAMQYSWEGLRVFQANNAKAEINAGNNDGNGSFAVVRVTDEQIDVVTARWTNTQGGYELIGPWFTGPTDVGRAP